MPATDHSMTRLNEDGSPHNNESGALSGEEYVKRVLADQDFNEPWDHLFERAEP